MLEACIKDYIQELKVKVNKAILGRDFEVLNRGEHTITIKVCGEVVAIWDVEHQETFMYSVQLGKGTIYVDDGELKSPKACRKILRELREDEASKINSEIEAKIKELEKQRIK